MRGLSGGLLAAQRTTSGKPATFLTVGGVDYADKLEKLRHIERPYGGRAAILLGNSDKSITTDHRGDEVVIGYGFRGVGNSKAAPLWVLTQKDVSYEGEVAVQLECIDIWLKLSLLKIIGGGGTQLKGTMAGVFQPGMKVTGQTSGATGTVIYTGEDYIAIGQVARIFQVAEEVQSDIYSAINLTVTDSSSFGGGSAPAWNGDKTILEIIQQLTSGVVTVVLDSSDGKIDSYKPHFETTAGAGVLDIIQDMMGKTTCGIKMKNDGDLHVFNMSAPGTDYIYNTAHSFFSDIRDTSSILPNRIIVINAIPSALGVTTYAGSDEDAVAKARFGIWITQVIIANVQSDAEADEVAASTLTRVQREATRGTVEVPMNCGQELFDYIRIDDNRADIDYHGWVGSLEHIWEPGTYRLIIGLGGLTGGERIAAEEEYPLPNIVPPIAPPIARFPWQLDFSPAYLPVTIDLEFTADDDDDVSWTSGNITCADGTVFSVNEGSLHLDNYNPYFLYYEIDNADLQHTQTFNESVSAERILIAFLKKALEANQKAMIIPASGGKTPTWNQEVISANAITANELYVQYLAAITANMGLLEAGEIRLGTGDLNATTSIATGGSTTTLEDSGQSWDVNGLVNKTIRIVQSGVTHERNITSNTATIITFTPALDVGVTTETYYLGGGSYTGWRLWEEAGLGRMAGFNSGIMQFYVGSDGKLYAANGTVILDYDGITITWAVGDTTASRLQFKYGGIRQGYISSGGGGFYVSNDNNADLLLLGYGTADIIVGTNELDRAMKPENTNYTNLGTMAKQWKGGFFGSRLKIPVGTNMYD